MNNSYIVETYLKENAFSMLRKAGKMFRHDFIDPGAGYYANLWDWDSYWATKALIRLCEYFKDSKDFQYLIQRETVLNHAAGCVNNFLDLQEEDGFIPMIVMEEGTFRTYLVDEHRAGRLVNQHKPFLCANALQISKECERWNLFDYDKLEKYLTYYFENQYDQKTGLFFWQNDVMIGIDNNPTVFGRPARSSADIYLNSFLYSEFQAISELFRRNGDAKRGQKWQEQAETLACAIDTLLYDPHDAFYYSADLLVENHKSQIFHHGMSPFWGALPMKIRFWGGFLPIYTGIAGEIRAKEILNKNYSDPNFLSPYGIRSLASNERMYNLESTSNPSNWLGPIWIVVQYCLWECLERVGMKQEADDLTQRVLHLLAMDIQKNGHMSESYRSDDGSPMMYSGFLNWNCLILCKMNK